MTKDKLKKLKETLTEILKSDLEKEFGIPPGPHNPKVPPTDINVSDLARIYEQVSEGKILKEVLSSSEYLVKSVHLIREYNLKTRECSTLDAFLSFDAADNALTDINKSERYSKVKYLYYIMEVPVMCLTSSQIVDEKIGKRFEEKDINQIYELLIEKVNNNKLLLRNLCKTAI